MSTDSEEDAAGFQAYCKTCERAWYGSVYLVKEAASRDAQAHDLDEHDGEVPTATVRQVQTVDGPEVPR